MAKERLIAEMREDFGPEWNDEDARRVDLGYHVLDPDWCFYDMLVDEGQMRRIVSDADIERALTTPPAGTRAAVRGTCCGGSARTSAPWSGTAWCSEETDTT